MRIELMAIKTLSITIEYLRAWHVLYGRNVVI
jgi:hypothetical protein